MDRIIVARPRFSGLFTRFRKDRRGISAVEFALIVPIMITLLFATAETTSGLRADRKLSLTARTMSDLASQASTIANGDMQNILNAGRAVMAPFPDNDLRAVVTGIAIDDRGRATVAWSDALNSTRKSCRSTITVPAGLMPPNGQTGFLVLAETEYSYRPTVPFLMNASIQLREQLYTRPRQGDSVTRMATTTTPQCP